ncbi:GDYXXLXY domain-containing protein [Lusitaniella coriacea]|uniref:GDYXXLXY domain-containing protein n=1 Tax=Lusitaniella coriacea TaxID=1983105 RepID=UPI003CF42A95
MTNPKPTWRFVLPLVFQTALILSIPAQAVYTHLSGQTVVLQTVPVDPYDLLRGYSQTLRYDISSPETLKLLPGWETVLTKQDNGEKALIDGTQLYVILQEPVSADNVSPPQAWIPIDISRDRPAELPDDRVALEGTAKNGQIQYGLETYYMPEDQRLSINQYIEETLVEAGGERPFVVEVKVDREGNSAAGSLWVGDREFRF